MIRYLGEKGEWYDGSSPGMITPSNQRDIKHQTFDRSSDDSTEEMSTAGSTGAKKGQTMAFGVKIKSVKPKRKYTIEELYEAIKDETFTAGTPELTKQGVAYIITFPPLDRQNQVWVMMNLKGDKISIQKSEASGMGNLVGNMALNEITDGLFGFGSMVGSNSKRCEQLVEETAKELAALDL